MRLAVECRFAPCSQTRFLAIRHGAQTLDDHTRNLIRESFAPDAWGPGSRGAPFQLSHNGPVIGTVVNITPLGQWCEADVIVDVPDWDPLSLVTRERVKPGARVSPGFEALREDRDNELRIVRHEAAHLIELSLLGPGDYAGYRGATITRVGPMRNNPADYRALRAQLTAR